MPQPKRGPRVGSGPAHARTMLANQACELFVHGRIKTTVSKAKQLRPYAEKLITKARGGDLHARRQVQAKLRDRDVVAWLFDDVAPRFADRPGGYTRILKLGPRKGDATPMAFIELVEQSERSGEEAIEESREQRSRGLMGRLRSRFGGGGSDEPEPEPEPGAEDTGTEEPDAGSGLQEQAPPEGPAEEPSAPDDPAAGDPVDETPDEPDAGAGSGKDAG